MKFEIIEDKEQLYDKCENMEELYDNYYYNLLVNYQVLKKQIEEYKKELEKADSITQSCIFNGKKESEISYRKCLNMLENLKEKNKEDYFKYYIQGSDHYLIPKDVFKELFNEMINWKEDTKKYKEVIDKAIEFIYAHSSMEPPYYEFREFYNVSNLSELLDILKEVE